jgi:hypothetical protein
MIYNCDLSQGHFSYRLQNQGTVVMKICSLIFKKSLIEITYVLTYLGHDT